MDMAVGTAIVAVTMAIAFSTFSSATSASDSFHCHDNMEIVANLEAKYRLSSSTHSFTTSISALNTMAPAMPLCPDGGTYTVTISTGSSTAQNGQTVPAGKIVISCSHAGHGKYAPEIDTP
jgi:hypothetical protein